MGVACMHKVKYQREKTYCEQDGKRLDSFNKATRHIARVVRSAE